MVPAWLLLFTVVGLYDFRHLLGGTTEYARAFHACTSGMMLVVLISFVYENFVIARGWLVMSWVLTVILVCTGRFVLRRTSYYLRHSREFFIAPALMIGTNQEAVALANQLGDGTQSGLRIHGYIDISESSSTSSAAEVEPSQILGQIENLANIIQQHGISEVVIATTSLSREQLLAVFQIVTALPDVEIRLSSGLYEALTTNNGSPHDGDSSIDGVEKSAPRSCGTLFEALT